jgi:hypothetical protein
MAQRLMIVEILVAQGQAEHPLRDQIFHGVFDQPGIAPVLEATGHAAGQAERTIQLAQQQHPAVRTECAPIERGHHFAPTQSLKFELLL